MYSVLYGLIENLFIDRGNSAHTTWYSVCRVSTNMPQILNWSETICLLHNIGYLYFQVSVSRQMYSIHYTSFFSHVLNEKCCIFIILLWFIFLSMVQSTMCLLIHICVIRHQRAKPREQYLLDWSARNVGDLFSTIKKICFTSYLKLILIKLYYLKNRLTSISPRKISACVTTIKI